MNRRMARRARLVAALAVAGIAFGSTPAHGAGSHQLIEGSGSSWATNALNVWIAGVTANGLKVVFTSTGSAQGRKDFGNSTTDFAVSDIGYQGHDPQTGDVDVPCKLGSTSDCRDYAYLPIVAGGTAFPYHIEQGGQLVRNLRLSGETLAKIFTGQITNWNDEQIKKDNNGRVLPSLPIIPVSHAEGSGSSAQFTTYLDSMYPSIWRGYTGKPGETEYFPVSSNGVQQTGSDGVINFITSAAANGAIGYDEYSYALAKNYPVAKVENAAGYFTLPTQFNVAVALTKAQINEDKSSPDYLLQKLDEVYRYTDPRTYPMSSYSYMIIPTASDDSRMNTAKRQTLADFIYYSVCQGQAQVGPVGYSPLPLNLVQASFDQVGKLKQADANVDLTQRNVTTCNNPTFVAGHLSENHLAQIAPKPPACDKAGQGPCTGEGDNGTSGIPHSSGNGSGDNSGNGNGNNGGTGSNNNGGNNPNGSGNNNSANGNGGNSPGGVVNPAGGSNPSGSNSSGTTTIDPDTGQPITTTGNGDTSGGGASPAAAQASLPPDRRPLSAKVLGPIAAGEMLGALILPPLVYFYVFNRRRNKS
jgi:phosphate transport system substrate-binding protein